VRRPELTRRRFLASTAAVAAVAAVAAARPWTALVRVVDPSAAARLAALFSHRESARTVGAACLAAAPVAPRSTGWSTRGAALPGGRSSIRLTSDEDLRDRLACRVRADFDEGLVVDVRGWVLSATEARLFAIAALA
jgi:hypothetical protein